MHCSSSQWLEILRLVADQMEWCWSPDFRPIRSTCCLESGSRLTEYESVHRVHRTEYLESGHDTLIVSPRSKFKKSDPRILPIGAILTSFKLVDKSLTRLNGLLSKARHSICPRCSTLPDSMSIPLKRRRRSSNILESMPMNGGVEWHMIMDLDLIGIQRIPQRSDSKLSLTSTSSPSSNINTGPGNWPFVRIIFLGLPSGAPVSQVKSHS